MTPKRWSIPAAFIALSYCGGCAQRAAEPVADDALGTMDHPDRMRLIDRCQLLSQSCYQERDLEALYKRNLQWTGIPSRGSEEQAKNWEQSLPWYVATAGSIDFLGPFARVEWTEKQKSPEYEETYKIYWILEDGEWYLLPWSLGRQWPDTWRCMLAQLLLAVPSPIEKKNAGGGRPGARGKGPPTDALARTAFNLLEEACVRTRWLVVDAYVDLLSDPLEEIRERAHARLVSAFGFDLGYDSKVNEGGQSAKWVLDWKQWLSTKYALTPRVDGYLQVELPVAKPSPREGK